MPKAVRALADKYLVDPQEILINPSNGTLNEIDQRCYFVRSEKKYATLLKILEMDEAQSALIFVRTKQRAQDLADDLMADGYSARAMHGDLSQKQREATLMSFRKRQITLMVATDVAARGLDIKDVSHVFNYDMPGDPEDYIHRVGRTGRAGCKGSAVTFFSKKEGKKLNQIESYSHQKIQEYAIPSQGEIQAKRDAAFLQKLVDQIKHGDMKHEQILVEQLMEMDYEAIDLAAAAIRLVRNVESPIIKDKQIKENSFIQERNSQPSHFKREYKEPVKKNSRSAQRTPSTDYHVHEQENGMVCVKMNLGKKQGIRPGDVVGTITGETGVPGKTIGKIHIFNDHTLVDISENHVQKILKNSNGQYKLRGVPVKLTIAN